MRIFITGTDTNVGKTIISSWLCLHTGFKYYKPLQTGIPKNSLESDTQVVFHHSKTYTIEEYWLHESPNAPYVIERLYGGFELKIKNIFIPQDEQLIIEGVGGVLVPINARERLVDMIQYFNASVIVVTRPDLGTINHTLLSLEALYHRAIPVLGIIVNGPCCKAVMHAIEHHGKTPIIGEFPRLGYISYKVLEEISLPYPIKKIFNLA